MKKLILLFVLLAVNFANAQAPNYEDLQILNADANYEKLIKVAEGYTLKDKTKNDALAHMWLAQGLYKMSLSGNADEKYKNAYKDAIGALGKCIKLDDKQGGAVQKEHEKFFNEFKASLVELIANDISVPDYKKAASWILRYYKLNATSIGAKYLEGACKYRNADKGGANTCWKDGETKLANITGIETWSAAEKDLLKMGVLQTVECYIAARQTEKAKALLGKVAQWFEGDADFKAKYDEVVN